MLSIITLPQDAATSTLAYAGTLFTDLWVLVAIAIGIPLAFYVIRSAIGLLPKGRGRRA
jgi:hypothetical protein